MTAPKTAAFDHPDAGILAQRYGLALVRFFERRLREPSEAQDLAQEVLLRLTQRDRRLEALGDSEEVCTSYIFATARSVLTDKLRRDQVRVRDAHCSLDGAAEMEVPSAERVYSAQERLQHLMQLMADLSPRVRDVFTLHRIDGLAYSEVAKSLGISVSTVEKHMIAALRFLMQHAAELGE